MTKPTKCTQDGYFTWFFSTSDKPDNGMYILYFFCFFIDGSASKYCMPLFPSLLPLVAKGLTKAITEEKGKV